MTAKNYYHVTKNTQFSYMVVGLTTGEICRNYSEHANVTLDGRVIRDRIFITLPQRSDVEIVRRLKERAVEFGVINGPDTFDILYGLSSITDFPPEYPDRDIDPMSNDIDYYCCHTYFPNADTALIILSPRLLFAVNDGFQMIYFPMTTSRLSEIINKYKFGIFSLNGAVIDTNIPQVFPQGGYCTNCGSFHNMMICDKCAIIENRYPQLVDIRKYCFGKQRLGVFTNCPPNPNKVTIKKIVLTYKTLVAKFTIDSLVDHGIHVSDDDIISGNIVNKRYKIYPVIPRRTAFAYKAVFKRHMNEYLLYVYVYSLRSISEESVERLLFPVDGDKYYFFLMNNVSLGDTL